MGYLRGTKSTLKNSEVLRFKFFPEVRVEK